MADDITNQQLLNKIDNKIDVSYKRLLDKIDTTREELLDGMTQQLGVITDNMATKEDLKAFATKDDLERVALRLERRISSNQKVSVNHHLAVRDDLGSLNRQVTKLREGLVQAAGPR